MAAELLTFPEERAFKDAERNLHRESARRDELKTQIASLGTSRAELSTAVARGDAAAHDRLDRLDEEQRRLERELAGVLALVAEAELAVTAASGPYQSALLIHQRQADQEREQQLEARRTQLKAELAELENTYQERLIDLRGQLTDCGERLRELRDARDQRELMARQRARQQQ